MNPPPLKTYYFEIYKRLNDKSQPYYLSIIKSANRKVVWTSCKYTNKQNCEIPVFKLINKLGKKICSLTYCDRVSKVNSEVKL